MSEIEKPSGSIKIIAKKGSLVERAIGGTYGKLNALPVNALLGVPGETFRKHTQDHAEELQEAVKDIPWQGNVEVYLGHSPLFRQLKRLFSSERRTNFFVRATIGIPTTINAWAAGLTSRSSLYNPFTETAQVYHTHKPIALHEIGHAEDFDQGMYPTLKALSGGIPFFNIAREWKASHNAMKHLTKEEKKDATKLLEPAFGSYIGYDLLPFMSVLKHLPFGGIFNPGAVTGVLAGHLDSRLRKKNIFYPTQQESLNNSSEATSNITPPQIPSPIHEDIPEEKTPLAIPTKIDLPEEKAA